MCLDWLREEAMSIPFSVSATRRRKSVAKINTFYLDTISIGVGSHFLPKKCLKGPKTQIQKLYQCLKKDCQ